MDYESCKYFIKNDVTPYHGDAYDHPSYRTACTKSGTPRTLPCPVTQCARCRSYVQKDTERTN